MKILVLGAGAREAALCYKIAQSPKAERVFVAPGNAGCGAWAECVPLDPVNFAQVKDFVIENGVDMLVVGPEEPLVRGIRDYFRMDAGLRGLQVVGPGKTAARLEGSKAFAKDFMKRAAVPTATYGVFGKEDAMRAEAFLREMRPPYVLKADGLAGGKGVLIETDYDRACERLREMWAGKFGEASEKVVIERFLDGQEVSVFVLFDGKNYVILPEARDYKQVGEGNVGLNTGGMGAVSPLPYVDSAFMEKVEARIIKPTFAQMEKERIAYSGFLYFGLMKVGEEPYLLEYNVRMGDPEAAVCLPRIENDFVEVLEALEAGRLHEVALKVSGRAAVCVVLASAGYPQQYRTGVEVRGCDAPESAVCNAPESAVCNAPESAGGDILLFHGATVRDSDGRMRTSGGRVLALTALAENLTAARRKVYAAAERIDFENKYYRGDIGAA